MLTDVTDCDPWLGLLDTGRVHEAGAARVRRRWLETAAAESATLAGVLLDLSDRAEPVSVRIAGGGPVVARIAGIGADVVLLEPGLGSLVLVPLRAVAAVRPLEGPLPLGDRPAPDRPRLADLLAGCAERRDAVAVRLDDGTSVVGVIDAVGTDVLRVRAEDPALGATYVSLASIGEVAVFRSG